MECEWCGDDMEPFAIGGGLNTCSMECENRQLQYAAIALEARFEGEDPPSRDEFKKRNERARKWTPDRMQHRIDELEALGSE